MSLRSFVKTGSIYWLGRMGSRVISFLLLPIYTALIKPEEWGVMNILTVTGDLLTLFALCQMPSALYKFWSKAKSEDEKKYLSGLGLLAPIVTSSILFLPMYLFPAGFAGLLGIPGSGKLLQIVLLSQQLSIVLTMIQAELRLRDKAKSFIFYELTFNFGSALLSIVLVVFAKMGIDGILLAQLGIYLCVTIPLFFKYLNGIQLNLDVKLFKKMLIFSLPLVPAAVAMGTNNNIARYFIQFYHGTAAVGLYSLGYKFGFLVNLLVTGPFFLIWEPKSYEVAKNPDAGVQYGRIFTYLMALLFFIAVGLTGASKEIIAIMAEKSYYSAWVVIPFVSFAYVMFSLDSISKIGLLVHNKTNILMSIVLLSACINVLGNVLLIPKLSILGAAISTFITFAGLFIIDLVISGRYLKIEYEWKRIGTILICSVIIIIACFAVPFRDVYIRIATKAILIGLFPVLLYICNFFTKRELALFHDGIAMLQKRILINKEV